ncbi:alpha/beta fold hydrolase [Streptomyces sp. SID4919]|uniref:alpha/beta fold hydrolase n=1 Tax=unclassified Streptomyces TaxID=2593676 RepID=UPI0008239166|nr:MULTISPECIES: alpha/beta hydrolase [unclassified Streptomyces]MYY12297.1 alpha/beta fold hydrolase [Streptomyces sp. SID4919]SCK53515.1 Pimeloyl-ACP methyl ester carboxylesterase [Streptomyces sp. AmelKG-E11A]
MDDATIHDTVPPGTPITVRAGGVALTCRTWGDPAAPPVLLLHCRGADGGDWAEVATALAVRHRVLAPDLPGHGRSEWSGGYTYEAMRDDVGALLDALGIGRTAVIGHSLGGAVAYLLAQRGPGRVSRLVLEDVPAPIPLDPPRPPAERPDEELPYDWEMILATDRQRNAPGAGWWDGMARITAPTLLIGGGPASFIPQDQILVLAGLVPDARVVTIDGGHLVHRERPGDFLAVVEPFLAS